MQICTPAILYVVNMYVFRTIVLAAVVCPGCILPIDMPIDTVYMTDLATSTARLVELQR